MSGAWTTSILRIVIVILCPILGRLRYARREEQPRDGTYAGLIAKVVPQRRHEYNRLILFELSTLRLGASAPRD
jgi:hypothetical protein